MSEQKIEGKRRLPLSEQIKVCKTMLKKYVDDGGVLEDLTRADEVYKKVKFLKLKNEDGSMMLLRDKFAYLGFPRAEQRNADPRQALIDAVEKAIANGEDFNACKKRTDLSFYQELCVYSRTFKNQKSHVELMKSIGYPSYNDTYYRLREVFDIAKYRDKDGYVDDYRKDPVFNDRIKAAALSYGMPTSIMVLLVLDEKLRKVKLEGDYIESLAQEVQSFAKSNGDSLVGFSTKDPVTYGKFNRVSHYLYNNFGINLDLDTLLSFFGVDGVDHKIKQKKAMTEKEKKQLFKILKEKEEQNGGILKKSDLSRTEYSKILMLATGKEISIGELMHGRNINYQSISSADRLSIIYVKEYPHLDKMKARRDAILKEKGFTAENGYCKEELFEEKVYAALQAYAEFNPECCCLKTTEDGELIEIEPEEFVSKIRNKRKMHREGAKTR